MKKEYEQEGTDFCKPALIMYVVLAIEVVLLFATVYGLYSLAKLIG